jgi:hypothetical protein
MCAPGRGNYKHSPLLDVHHQLSAFQVRQQSDGLTLMADFAQGLDASKLILAETVRLSNSSAGFVSTHS